MAQRYGCRPSALLAVEDPYAAYCVDEAAALAAVYTAKDPDSTSSTPSSPGKPASEAKIGVENGVPFISGRVEMIRKPK